MTIKRIKVNKKWISFRSPINIRIVCHPRYPKLPIKSDIYSVDSDIFAIHEMYSNLKKLKREVREDIVVQWEDIAMADDKMLTADALALKKYLLTMAGVEN